MKQMDLTNLDTSNLTDMSGMFCGAYKVKSLGNLSGWDVSHVTNMQQMFDENTYDSPALESLDGINKWNVSNVQNILCLFRNDTNLKDIDISGWDLSKATGGWTTGQVFASFTNISKTVINLNNVKLPSDFNLETSFANGQVVITNNGDLLQLDTTSKTPFKDNLTFRQYNSWGYYANPTVKTYSHSIFYDSKGSSDAKAIVQGVIDTFLHNNYANYQKVTIPTNAVYLSTKPSDSATAIANETYDIAKTETSDTTYHVFRDDEIPMQLTYVETDNNKNLGTVTVVGNGITIVTPYNTGLNPLPVTNLADWLGNDDYTKSDMSITGQKHFGFDGIAEPVNVEINLTKKVITEQRTVTVHLYERDSNGDPVKDSNGNYVSVAPDLKATFNYRQDEFVNSKGKVVKKSNIWLWDEKAPKTYDGANSQEVNVGYIEGVQSISNVKCWKVPINKEGTSYILVPNDGNWSTVEFSTPAVDGYYANPFIDNIVNGYPLLGRPANLFVNPRFNNSVRPGTSDTSDSSIAYTNQDGIYENKNEHIIWYFPKENTATIKRTINFVKNDASHTQLQETSTQDVNLNGSLVAANPNGTGKDYFTIYPAEYNDASIVTGSPIAVINNSNKPTYSWKAKDGQTSVNTDITGYTVSAVKIGNADYSTNENDIKYAKEIAQNTATLDSPADLNISFVYAPASLTSSYEFVDDDNKEQVIEPATSFSGKTGETVELNIKLPANYELAKGSTLPTSYTFKPSDNEQLKIHLIHQKKVLSDDTRTIRRKVTITDPDGKVDPKSTTQSVSFSRSDTLDKVTNKHIYGKWNKNQQTLLAIALSVFAGYTPSGKVDAINVTADSNNPADINISYTADKQNSFYQFVDDNEEGAKVGTSHPISGTTDEMVDLTKAIKDSVPTNYDLVPDQSMSYIFKASDNKPLIIHLTHQKKVLSDDTRTISRKVTITDPDGKVDPESTTQSVSFSRSNTLDKVTNQHIYGEWNTKQQTLPAIVLPVFPGYTPSGKVDAINVTADSNDPADINISYTADKQNSSYQFVDDNEKGAKIGTSHPISGTTDEMVDLTKAIKDSVPTNYDLVPDQNMSYIFKASDNKPLIIHLTHQKKVLSDDTRTISRKVTITDPDGKVDPKSTTQSVTFSRSDTLDKVTNKHIYGKWNKNQQTLPAITLSVFAGYTPSGKVDAINVTADSNNPADINISYIADKQNSSYKFVDDNENEATVGTSHPISGTTDETIDLTKAIKDSVPTNYDLVPDQNMSYIFKASDNKPLIIHLTHHISAVTNDSNLTKTVSRTINVTKPDGTKLAPVVQRVSFIQTATKDDVTGKVTYNNDWKANGKDSFTEYDAPVVDGYTANPAKIEKFTPNVNTKDSTKNIVYEAGSQSITVRFIDKDNKDQQVGEAISINGVTGKSADFSAVVVPENYVLAEGEKLPTNHKFTANDQTVYTVELRHKTEDAKIDPNAKLSQKVSRTILITKLDGSVNKIIQEHTFTRTGEKDMVTGNINYGPWSENGSYTFTAIIVKNIAGYAISGSAPKMVVTPETKDSTVNISYVANGQTNYYQFIDDDYQAGDPVINQRHDFAGKTGEAVKLNISVPQNYDLAKSNVVPIAYTFKTNNNQPIVIHLVHHLSAITNDPKLMKQVTRTINVTKPDGTKLAPVVQRVSFIQTATKDDVTGKITYHHDWKVNGGNSFTEYDAPIVDGYTANPAKIEKLTPDVNTKDSIVNIVYKADSQSITVRFIDKDNKDQQVGKTISINGVTGESADFSSVVVPENYVLAEGEKLPTNHKFTADDQTVYTVELRHKTENAKIDPNAKLSQKVSRTILITQLDGSVNKIIQEHTFTRTGEKDMVTGNINYGPWSENGKYTFNDISVKAIAGYAISGSAPEVVVTPETKDSTVKISYVANGQTSYYQFIDEDYQAGDPVINQKHPIAGKTGDRINLNITIPKNYDLAKGSILPTSYTFKVSDNKPLVIYLVHQKEALSDDTKAVRRKVTITDPDGKVDPKSTTQSVTFGRSDTLDKVTNKHIYGKWNKNQQTLPAIALSVFAGYTPSGKVDAINVTADSNNPADINISYTADKQNSFYQFVDDNEEGTKVGTSHPISGTTDEMVDLTKAIKDSVPTNYDLVPDQNMSYTFKATDNAPIMIHLTHHISDLVNDSSLTKTVSRTILITNIAGKIDKTIQKHTFTRIGKKDMVTGNISYGPWSDNSKYAFAAMQVQAVKGYAINGSAPEMVVTPETKDSTVNIRYLANGQTSYYQFIDDDYQVGDPVINQKHTIAGKTGEDIKLNISIPQNYDLVQGAILPTSYTFGADNNKPVIIHLVHQLSKVANDPKLTKVIARTINVTKPDGTTNSIVQAVKFVQTAIKDAVTNNISFMNDWKNVGSDSFAEYNVPEIKGYTPSQSKVEKLTPKFNNQNEIINISYIKNKQLNPTKPVKPIVTPISSDNKEQSTNKQHISTNIAESKVITENMEQHISKPNRTNNLISEKENEPRYMSHSQVTTMKKVDDVKKPKRINKIKTEKATLPQTGNNNEKTAAIVATGLAVDLSLIGLAGLKKKRLN
ncbi:BspA family leucine-rich repeat surface protein [Lactobacillus gasseri]|nr:BspA family leucine-rich repeat surface protein [Lactobacillus gasseri]